MATTHSNESILLHRFRLCLHILRFYPTALLLLNAIRSFPFLLKILSNHLGTSDDVTTDILRLRAKIALYMDTYLGRYTEPRRKGILAHLGHYK
jgi:hypothetical protein